MDKLPLKEKRASEISAELGASDELLIAYLEGDLPPAKAQELRARLLSDPALRGEYDALKAIAEASVELTREGAPPDFLEQVQGRICQASDGQFFGEGAAKRAFLPSRYELFSAAMILLIAAAWILGGSPRDRSLRHVDMASPPPLQTSHSASLPR